jgi:hypothetical protein
MPHTDETVKGYQPQGEMAIHLVNHMKEEEEKILRMLDKLVSSEHIDKRWLQIGRTHIEQGFMAVNRSIFQPKRVVLDSEA